MSVIQVNGLVKDYGNQKGVFHVNLGINENDVYGFLGPNGAGKTTTIRHLIGFLNPDEGECFILGKRCRDEFSSIANRVGYLPGEINFMDNMTGIEFLRFQADLRGMKDLSLMNELISLFELDPSGKIKKMSKGMKQKIGLICAFMHNPDILILDEPTSGLDPLMQHVFIEYIRKLKREGKTILMSSHSFDEIEKTCDRVGIIKNGKLIIDKPLQELLTKRKRLYEIKFKTEKDKVAFMTKQFNVTKIEDLTLQLAVVGDIQPFLKSCVEHNVISLNVISQNLDDIFMTYYGGNEND